MVGFKKNTEIDNMCFKTWL